MNFAKFNIQSSPDDKNVSEDGNEGGGGLLSVQKEDGMVSDMSIFEADKELTEEQIMLLQEISERFSAEDDAADLSILYEVTGYKAESQNFEFWSAYTDFEELGETKLFRKDGKS